MGSRTLRRHAGRAILCCLGALGSSVGCTFQAGPLSGALFGSYYVHHEEYGAAQPDDVTEWRTVIGRTYGTVDIKAKIGPKKEKVESTGEGMSAKMAGVLGKDLGKVIARSVVCALQPLQAGCVVGSDE